MKIQSKLRNLLIALGLATLANSASAAFINFIEDVPTDESPFTVSTNMPGTSLINADGVTFNGIIPFDITGDFLVPRTYIGGLLEPDDPAMVSDYVVLTAGEPDFTNEIFQAIRIDVFSIDTLLSDIIAFAQKTYGLTINSANFLTEDGTLQDISGVMGTGDENFGLKVSIQSAIVENDVPKVPELSSLLLMSIGLAAFAGYRRKKISFCMGLEENGTCKL